MGSWVGSSSGWTFWRREKSYTTIGILTLGLSGLYTSYCTDYTIVALVHWFQ
jgi:hypothetical protein